MIYLPRQITQILGSIRIKPVTVLTVVLNPAFEVNMCNSQTHVHVKASR